MTEPNFEPFTELTPVILASLLSQWERVAKDAAGTVDINAFLIELIRALPELVKAHKKLTAVCGAIAYLQEKGYALEAWRNDGETMVAPEYADAVIQGALKLGWQPPRSLN